MPIPSMVIINLGIPDVDETKLLQFGTFQGEKRIPFRKPTSLCRGAPYIRKPGKIGKDGGKDLYIAMTPNIPSPSVLKARYFDIPDSICMTASTGETPSYAGFQQVPNQSNFCPVYLGDPFVTRNKTKNNEEKECETRYFVSFGDGWLTSWSHCSFALQGADGQGGGNYPSLIV
ncbi:hypothetical protein NPIL_396491 [Nephila pilipes]|uniref:Uncharacterized protein n=1 Tax=Nephila pilipes TaxID=299642 RepID=A0A8X6N0H8_NEPPI|nr:hypothetical protein NPIL_396491 [Nephila pilipes]